MRRRSRLPYFLFLLALAVTPVDGWGEGGVVLAIRPEGVLVEFDQIPDVRPGTKLGFVRPDDRKETGSGWILDIREGRALVGVKPGATVRQGDLVVVCLQPGQADPYQELRTMLGRVRDQAARPRVRKTSQLQAVIDQLQLALEAREAAVQEKTCDTGEYDSQISALATDLQSVSAALQPGGELSGTGPIATPAQEPEASAATPPASLPSAAEQAPVSGMTEMLSKITEILHLILGKASAGSAGPGSVESGTEGGTIPTVAQSPGGGADVSTLPPSSPSPGVGTEEGSLPPAPPAAGTSASLPSGPSAPQLATVLGRVRGERGKPVSGATVTALEWNQTISTAPDGSYYLRGPGGQVTITTTAAGYQVGSVVTLVAPGAVTTRNIFLRQEPQAAVGMTKPDDKKDDKKGEAATPASATPQPSPPSAGVPWWRAPTTRTPHPSPEATPVPSPGITPHKPDVPKPRIGALPKVIAKEGKPAKISGRVLNEQGAPVAEARVTVDGAGTVVTNTRGRFTVQNVKPGEHQVTATAPGFRAEAHTVTLEAGEVKSVEFTLRSVAAVPEKPLVLKPTLPKPAITPHQ